MSAQHLEILTLGGHVRSQIISCLNSVYNVKCYKWHACLVIDKPNIVDFLNKLITRALRYTVLLS